MAALEEMTGHAEKVLTTKIRTINYTGDNYES